MSGEVTVHDVELESVEAYARLARIYENREPVTITTDVNVVHANMLLTSLCLHPAKSADVLQRYTATFTQVVVTR